MSEIAERLRAALGDEAVRSEPEALARHRRDTLGALGAARPRGRGAARRRPRWSSRRAPRRSRRCCAPCREARTPVVPYGGGSGVCGGVLAPDGRGRALDAAHGRARRARGPRPARDASAPARTDRRRAARAGGRPHASATGRSRSSSRRWAAGWRRAPPASSRPPTATSRTCSSPSRPCCPTAAIVRTRDTPRASAGPDLRQIFLGSEGTLGVVTEVTFSLRPAARGRRAARPSTSRLSTTGLEAIRRLMRAGWRPPVVRLYDAHESERSFGEYCPKGRALLLLLHEGPAPRRSRRELARRDADLRRARRRRRVDSAAVDHWLEHRNRVPGLPRLPRARHRARHDRGRRHLEPRRARSTSA